ncbi:hypothetical protein [Nitrospira sp. BLG_2]|uniref:hypothetical protein n=1 Tax=Nitrospira sp. BLG_2 TaxID=3397507 RepID=UPI003B9BC66F
MVNSAVFLPADDDLACLGRIHGKARVLRQHFEQEVLNRTLNQVLIVADDGTAVCIDSDYGDVQFKFECFFLKVFSCAPDSWGETLEICKVGEWHSVKCLFRFEYERPAAEGEVPSSWVQVVRRLAKRNELPEEATAIGCALVGIVFWNSVKRFPILLVANGDIDGDDPTAIQVSQEREMIELFMESCESINLEDVPKWAAEVRSWLSDR